MLQKAHRLTKHTFDVFFRSGRRFNSPTLQLIYTPHNEFHGAVVVPKKIHKSAVARNRLRRQLYTVLYSAARTQPGVYIVVVKKTPEPTELRTLIGRVVDTGVE